MLRNNEYQRIKFNQKVPVKQLIDNQDIYGVIFKGKLHDLNWIPKEVGELYLVDKNSDIGKQIYSRSLSFLFIAAIKRLYQDAEVSIEHALSGGVFCKVNIENHSLNLNDLSDIKNELHKMVLEALPIQREVVETLKAVSFFESIGYKQKADLLRNRKSKTSSIYKLDKSYDYFYGIMLPNTSYLKSFYLKLYKGGIWLSSKNSFNDQSGMFEVFQEYERWGKLIQVSSIADLNNQILKGNIDELVLMSETKMEKELALLADRIFLNKPNTRFIFISGPSSAGKTTFSRRLAINLRILGKKPVTISMDDFFLNRVDTPLLADGSYDLESPFALDLKLFKDTINSLINRDKVQIPHFNFKAGKREWTGKELSLKEDEIIIVEGIHALNPIINEFIDKQYLFKIYINALTHLNLDPHNHITTSDYRLIRRIVRDYQFRGRSAKETIAFWKNVKEGEEKYIFPYQELADEIFNTSMVYELAILKDIALKQLNQIQLKEPEYLEANRLKKLLEYFISANKDAVPRNSILAEFIGISVFDVS